ncbi:MULTISPECIES: outer membrane beta-barrel protein [unclassified Sphingomonas]|uniref:outer membrane beta-barrel protein n=1 Tax=unclassified Sphingomonas TaxID=196159 RepID=UPI0012E0ED27|nr:MULTISPECIES: outer membrane beta-barrel protein [unclassified Sphingomonas]
MKPYMLSRHRAFGTLVPLVAGIMTVPAMAQTVSPAFQPRETRVERPRNREPAFTLSAGLLGTYDDNIFRIDSQRQQPVDDFILTPSVTAQYKRQIGSNDVTVRGDASYGYYIKNPGRSRVQAVLDTQGTFRIAGTCVLKPLARIQRQRADYGDINGSIDNFQTFTALGLEATCPRTVGFFPIVGVRRDTSDNDPRFAFANQKAVSYTAGIGYARPSIGTMTAYYNRIDSDRSAIGVTNHIDRAGVTFVRSVVSSASLKADIQYLNARSVGAVVRPYRGLGWAGELIYRPLPRLALTGTTDRRIINDTLVPAGFAVQTDYGLRADWQFAERTQIRVQGNYATRSFRGDPLVIVSGINSDTLVDGLVRMTRRVGARIDLFAEGRHISRQTDTDANQYKVTLATGGITYRF